MDENRKSIRMRTLKGGRISFNRGASSLDCLIRNMSAGGAKLAFESTLGLPDQFDLLFADGSVQHCTVRWPKLTDIGVSFHPDPT